MCSNRACCWPPCAPHLRKDQPADGGQHRRPPLSKIKGLSTWAATFGGPVTRTNNKIVTGPPRLISTAPESGLVHAHLRLVVGLRDPEGPDMFRPLPHHSNRHPHADDLKTIEVTFPPYVQALPRVLSLAGAN